MPSSSPKSAPRTVVHILASGTRGDSAQARTVATLGRLIDPARYRLRAWFLEDGDELRDGLHLAGVPTRQVEFSGIGDVSGMRRLASAIRSERPALIHTHVLGGRRLIWLLKGLSAAKIVAHLWGTHSEELRPLRLGRMSTADAVLAASKAVAAAAGGDVTVVYPGVEVANEAAHPPSAPPVIGTAARLEPVKNLSALVEALALLRRRGSDARVEIAGQGSSQPGLLALAQRLGIADAITFLGWRDDVEALHGAWRAFAAPSLYEGFPLAALEAMASGLPIVASDTGGLPEMVDDGRTGFLVPVGDAEALAQRLALLLSDDQLCGRMSSASRERVRQRFSATRMAAETLEIYDRLLAGS
jgi:glycosyltransferase involved in cell wall biosynthesis